MKKSPWPPTLAAVAFLLLMVGGYAIKYDGKVTALIHFGRMFLDRPRVPEHFFIWGKEGDQSYAGYDGQFFYYMALNPYRVFHYPELDNPPYRAQRVLYPVLAHAFSGGKPEAVPFALLGINVLALGLMTWWLAKIALRFDRSSWWGLAGTVSIGTLLPLTFCLGEPLAAACLTGAVWATLEGKLGGTIVGLVLSGLAREQLVVMMPLFGGYWWVRKGWRSALWSAGLPMLAWTVWQGWAGYLYGVIPTLAKEYTLWGWPGFAWAERLYRLVTLGHSHCEGPEFLFLLWLGAVTVMTIRGGMRGAWRTSFGWWLVASQLAFALALNYHLWVSMVNHARQLITLPAALLIWEGEAPSKSKRIALWVSVILGVAWLACDITG